MNNDIKYTVQVHNDPLGLVVQPEVTSPDVDIKRLPGYIVKDARMADRLKRAIEAGVVYYDLSVRENIHGETYVSSNSRVLGRRMNVDLRILGY